MQTNLFQKIIDSIKILYRKSFGFFIIFILVAISLNWFFPKSALAAFPTGWSYYQVITLPAVKNLSSFPYLLTNLPTEVYSHARSDGGDIRFTTSDGATELPREIVSFNVGANTAEIWVLVPTLTAVGTNNIRVYYGASSQTEPAANSTYGSQAVWTGYAGVYHLKEAVNTDVGGYKDSTANANNMTGISMAMSATTGQIGTSAEFDGSTDYLLSTTMPASNYPLTVSGWMWLNNETTNHTLVGLGKSDSTETRQDLVAWGDASLSNDPILAYSRNVNTFGFAQKTDFPASSWFYAAGLFTSSVSRNAFLNGVGGSEETSPVSWATYDAFTIGVHKGLSNSGFASGKIDEVHVSASARSSDWLYAEYWTGANQTTPLYGGELAANPIGNPSAPTLVSPANSIFTADNTPTLSATYIDDDSVGTTNYRVASTSASDCLSGTHLVASGSSSQTTTSNEATSFTPVSSIGSTGTYYWCAQNVNGANISDWTTMGSFTLDTTSPSVPGTPTVTSGVTDNTPAWTWTISTDSGSGLHVTSPYVVKWSQDENFVSSVFASTSNTNSFTHTDSLANGTWYFKVSAKDAVNNESNFSANGSISVNTNASTMQVSYASTDSNGVKSYNITSDRNGNGTYTLRVLEPNNPTAGVAHSFLYVLPVEARLNTVFGDGLEAVRALGAQNQYNMTVIAPSFDIMPWYADHATNTNYRYESFMSLELQPWVKANLATTGNEQHWLLGFSKSGYGAMSLLLKNSNLFTLGAFWDFPAGMSDYTSYDANTNYGTQSNFDNNYRLTSTFLENYKTHFLNDNRVWINGYGMFRTDMQNFDSLLTTKGIQHTTAAEVSRSHNWTSGWVSSALAGLYANSTVASTEITTTDSGTDTSVHGADVTVTLNCSDASGSGCAHTYYTIDGSTPTTSSSQGTSIVISNNGSYTIKYFSVNNIGLQEAVKTAANTVRINKQISTGGGGGCYGCYANINIPNGGFKITANQGVSTTTSRTATLNFNASFDIKKMAISLSGDFSDAIQEDYSPTKQIDLCSKLGGLIKNINCPDGKYTVYVKFYTQYGKASDVATTTINLRQGNSLPAIGLLTKYLQYQETNNDVKRLQIFLNSDSDTQITDNGAGSPGKETNYFGLLTYKAVIKFQEKYAKDTLLPWGFKKGTGYVGKTTLNKINELIGNK